MRRGGMSVRYTAFERKLPENIPVRKCKATPLLCQSASNCIPQLTLGIAGQGRIMFFTV